MSPVATLPYINAFPCQDLFTGLEWNCWDVREFWHRDATEVVLPLPGLGASQLLGSLCGHTMWCFLAIVLTEYSPERLGVLIPISHATFHQSKF